MAVKCGNCDEHHPSRVEVRACFAASRGLAESRAIVREAKPKVPTHETFGQTMRRRAQAKPSCWACPSTDIEYRVLKGKQLLCCPEHPKTTHPDYVLTPEQVAEKLGGTTGCCSQPAVQAGQRAQGFS